MTIAVLAVQGAFIEHEKKLEHLGADCIELRKAEDLNQHYDGIVLPGGMPGTLNLGKHEIVKKVITSYAAGGKLTAAICAAPSVLGENGILEGKHAVSYPGFEEKLLGARVGAEKVAVDGNIVTSRGMGTAIEFAMAIVKWLDPQADIDAMEANIMYFK